MVILEELIAVDYVKKTQKVALFADDRSEVTNDVDFEGKKEGFSIAMGSSVMTSGKEMAFMKSNGQWNWGD